MFMSGDFSRTTLAALFEEKRHWSEYDKYREVPSATTEDPNSKPEKMTVEIIREGKVLWSNTMLRHELETFSLQEREDWCAACFRVSVAESGLIVIEGLIADCTDRNVRKALKKQLKEVRKHEAPDIRHSSRMYRRSARAERDAQEADENDQALSWLRRTSR